MPRLSGVSDTVELDSTESMTLRNYKDLFTLRKTKKYLKNFEPLHKNASAYEFWFPNGFES